jgi:sulfopyruvate decarboxylase TPP-binding subunit
MAVETKLVSSDLADALHAGLIAAGVRHCIYLPDSVMGPLTDRCERDARIDTLVCAREDEGIAVAAGLFVTGRRAVVMMEASGIGLSGLILARAQIQRTPVFIMASHGALLGEAFDFHAATNAAGRGVVAGLGISSYALGGQDDPAEIVRLALDSVHGQRTSFAIFIPPHLMVRGSSAGRA